MTSVADKRRFITDIVKWLRDHESKTVTHTKNLDKLGIITLELIHIRLGELERLLQNIPPQNIPPEETTNEMLSEMEKMRRPPFTRDWDRLLLKVLRSLLA